MPSNLDVINYMTHHYLMNSVSSVSQSCLTLCNPMDCSFPVHHQLPELDHSHVHRVLDHSHVHRVSDAIRASHPLLSPFSPAFSLSGSFPMSQFFTSGGKIIGASASVLLMNIQDWSPLGWAGLISLQFKGLSRVFSNTTVQKHQFFGIHAWLLEQHCFDYRELYWLFNVSAF